MKAWVKNILERTGFDIRRTDADRQRYRKLHKKYAEYTMTSEKRFIANLELCAKFSHLEGAYVECGVWKGGMSAAIAEVIGEKHDIHLFDSFEGLPPAKEIDGKAALHWQQDKNSPTYFDNCKIDESVARQVMGMSGHNRFTLHKGFFEQTLPIFPKTQIAILRLDGDWYDSIMTSLKYLYPMVVHDGLVILDDYPYWEGCSKAVHRYLADVGSASRIHQLEDTVTYLVKKDNGYV